MGRKLSAVLSAVLVIYQLGSCAAYLIIVGDSFVPLIEKVVEPGGWLADRRVIVTFFALVVILPLCLPRCAARRCCRRCSAWLHGNGKRAPKPFPAAQAVAELIVSSLHLHRHGPAANTSLCL